MKKEKIYLDTSLLIAAFQGKDELAERAFQIIDCPSHSLVVSEAVRLELFPKVIYHKKEDELEFYREIFQAATVIRWSETILRQAFELACEFGVAAMDSIHLACALEADVDIFYTAEKATKPMFRVTDLKVCSIQREN